MDFLKSAVASAIAKGSSFPYTFEDRLDHDESIWTLHSARKRVSRCLLQRAVLHANSNERKMVQLAPYSPSTYKGTNPVYPLPEMLCAKYEP